MNAIGAHAGGFMTKDELLNTHSGSFRTLHSLAIAYSNCLMFSVYVYQ